MFFNKTLHIYFIQCIQVLQVFNLFFFFHLECENDVCLVSERTFPPLIRSTRKMKKIGKHISTGEGRIDTIL